MKKTLTAITFAITIAGCQTPPAATGSTPPSASTPTSQDGYTWTLELKDALAIIRQDDFRSAVALAAMRPSPKAEITQITYEIFDADGHASPPSIKRLSRLPNGLEHVSHDAPASQDETALHETWIEAYGLAQDMYWNSRFSGRNGPRPAPRRYELRSGRLFSMHTPFVLQQIDADDSKMTRHCSPVTSAPASKLHPDLTGLAGEFVCDIPEKNAVERTWYLEDYARYLVLETSIDGELLSRLKVAGIRTGGVALE